MIEKLLICTDLDRTLIPNGSQPESDGARQHFTTLVNRAEITLTYVSGRHQSLIKKAIQQYQLPLPDFVVGDVGTSLYHIDTERCWQRQTSWENNFSSDWANLHHSDLEKLLQGIQYLTCQEKTKQSPFKLSYYVPIQADRNALSDQIHERLSTTDAQFRLIWSSDEPNDIGLLDILPQGASKFHAVEALMREHGFDRSNTLFCGDSGNDIEVMASPISSVLVANSPEEIQLLARRLSNDNNVSEQLYIAQGDFMGMNGNYAAGMLEGIAYYHPDTVNWMGFHVARESDP